MHYKYLIYFFLIFLVSCEHHSSKIIYKEEIKKTQKIKKVEDVKGIDQLDISKLRVYKNKGFALIYDENLFEKKIINKKIDDNTIVIFNKNLVKNTPVKIINLINGKKLISKIDNDIEYPFFYNSLISKRVVNELLIDFTEPYILIETINSNNIYVANEAKTFDEEKNVANKAPVDTITIQNIGNNESLNTQKIKKKIKDFKYIIKFADLYFEESATMLKDRLVNEFNIEEIHIKKLSSNKFRVFKGPYKDLGSLKKAYNDIGKVDFENIEIIKL